MILNSKNKEILRVILAVCMVVAGILHFAKPIPFVKIVPDLLPYPLALVWISGAIEILCGIGLLIPPIAQTTAWVLIALFIAVFPANINMAVNNISLEGIPNSPWLQAIRLPFQGVLIAWAYWYTKLDNNPKQASILPGYPQRDSTGE